MGENRVAVIGAGNGGSSIAAYMASKGAAVNLCDLFPEYIEGIKKHGGIDLTYNGETHYWKMNLITTDIGEAVKGIKLIMVVTPSFTHELVAEAIAGHLTDGQVIVLNPGRTCGALAFRDVLQRNKCTADVVIAEAQTLIYSCRKTGEAQAEIYGVKKEVDLSAFPGEKTESVISLIKPYYPQFCPVDNCLETSMANIGALFHPAPVLFNLGRIESDKRGFRHYWDGITPAVAGFIHALDMERLEVAKAYGVSIMSAEEWLVNSYDTSGDNLYELLQHNMAYSEIKAPKYIHVRYIMEDVPMSLVPISELGHIAGVPTPNIDAVITIASTIYETDFRASGRCAEKLGIADMEKDELTQYLRTGKKHVG